MHSVSNWIKHILHLALELKNWLTFPGSALALMGAPSLSWQSGNWDRYVIILSSST